MNTPPFVGGIVLAPGNQGPPIPANGLGLTTIAGALNSTTDGITFSPVALSAGQSAKLAAVDLFNAGAALTDAAATVNSASDKASEYTLPVATLTANRVLTLGVTGSPVTGSLVQITRRDLTAHTYTVQDDASTSLLVFASGPTVPQGAVFKYDGAHFTFQSFFYVAA